jgi:7-cyano-7-deazaguanine synthase
MQRDEDPGGLGRFDSLAVLLSGGLDSAILLTEAIESHTVVFPLYVRTGLAWEPDELAHVGHFLGAVRRPGLESLVVLDLPVGDLYRAHWSITGRSVPGADTPDEAVFLPGRNVLLLAKAMLWCHLRNVPAVALATLRGNPFPDATSAFFHSYQEVVNRAVDGKVQILRPFAHLGKTEVLRRGRGLPLELTFSCIAPVQGRHCGGCNKCAERRKAFTAAGIDDPTVYAALPEAAG